MRYLILFLSLAFVQCKKDNFSYYSGRATANLNGVVWSAKVHIGKNSPNDTLFDILIDRFNTRGEVSEDLFIFEIALKLGRQKIYQGDTHDSIYAPGCSYVTVVGGDANCDVYDVSASDTLYNHITLTEIEPLSRIVAGKFDLRLIVSSLPKCDPTAKDTLIFSNGTLLAPY